MAALGGRTSPVLLHARVWRQAFNQSVSRELQFRAHAVTTLVVSLIQSAVTILPTLLVFGYLRNVNGWTAGEVVATVGLSQTILSLLAAFVAPNLSRMTRYVRRGELDLILLRPVSAQFFTTFRWIQPAELFGTAIGLIMTVVGVSMSGIPVTVPLVLAGIAWFAIGLTLVTCLWANLAYLALWFQSAEPIADLMVDLLSMGRYPMAFFPRGVQVLMGTVIPIGVATTLPVSTLAGHLDLAWLVAGSAFAVSAVVLARLHWQLALGRYESASS